MGQVSPASLLPSRILPVSSRASRVSFPSWENWEVHLTWSRQAGLGKGFSVEEATGALEPTARQEPQAQPGQLLPSCLCSISILRVVSSLSSGDQPPVSQGCLCIDPRCQTV